MEKSIEKAWTVVSLLSTCQDEELGKIKPQKKEWITSGTLRRNIIDI